MSKFRQVSKRYRLFSIGFALFNVFPAVAHGQDASKNTATITPGSIYANLEDEELIEILENIDPEDSCSLAALLDEMDRRGSFPGPVKVEKFNSHIQCSISNDNFSEAYEYLLKLEEENKEGRNVSELGFSLALFSGNAEDAAERLVNIFQVDQDENLEKIRSEVIFFLIRQLNKEEKFELVNKIYQALRESQGFEKVDSGLKSAAYNNAVESNLELGNQAKAIEQLPKITSPYFIKRALSERKFEPIWPEIEAVAGRNMTAILDKYLEQEKRALKAAPEDKEQKQYYGHSLLFAAKYEELFDLAKSIDHSSAGALMWEEQDGWLLNLEAYGLDDLGRRAEADIIFDRFAEIPYDPQKNYWLVSFVINRATRLVGQKRFNEGLEAANYAAGVAEKSGNDYAKSLVSSAKICSLVALNRTQEAEAVLKTFKELDDPSKKILANAYLCMGQKDTAADIVIAELRSESGRSAMLEELQPKEFELFYTRTELPTIYSELKDHPTIASEFQKAAREIPLRFLPPRALAQKLTREK